MKLNIIAQTDKLVRGIKLMDPTTRKHVSKAVVRGTVKVARGAITRVKVKSGELQSSIRDEYSKDGMMGFVKAGYGKLERRSKSVKASRVSRLKARRRAERLKKAKSSKSALSATSLGVYAPVIERGDPKRNRAPQPFLYPSLKAEVPGISRDIARALDDGMDQAMEVTK